MFGQIVVRGVKLSLSNCTINCLILSRQTVLSCQCTHHRNFQHKPVMSKVISKKAKGRDLDNGHRKKTPYKIKLLNSGQVPTVQYLYVNVVKSGAFDESKSVVVETSHQSYLFNCGEGTQRMSDYRKLQIEDVFLTHNSWENIGGLFGMMMSLGQHDKDIRLHGPPNVEQVLKMTKSFSETPSSVANLEKREICSGSYSDWLMDIEYVKIPRVHGVACNDKNIEESTGTSDTSDEESTTEEPVKKRRRSNEEDQNFAVAYILRMKETGIRRGKVSIEKLRALNVKRGPWLSEITAGKTATLPDGRVIKPEDVIESLSKSISPIVILECPTHDYLDSLSSSEQLLKMAGDEKDEPCLIVHMTPTHILEAPAYQVFMNRYKKTDHLLLNNKSKSSILTSSMEFHQCLNYIHSGLFPELHSYRTHAEKTSPSEGHVVQGEHHLRYHCMPPKGFDWNSCSVLSQERTIQEVLDQTLDAGTFLKKLEPTPISPKDKRPYPEVIFLGTGSAVPSAYRNVTGILLHLSPEKCVLLDSGEGTCEQIRLLYGDEADEKVFSKMVAVFISHLHCDHHMGLFAIINARRKALQKLGLPVSRLLILAPIQFQRWLFLYCRFIMNLFDEIQHLWHLNNPSQTPARDSMESTILETLDLEEFNPVPVNHVPNSFGVSMKHKDGWKLVYSGDTMPCKRLINEGKGCDLLIHEATFSDELEFDALAKNHSTVSQALQVGKEMEAKFIILNHFSQRYDKIPTFTEKFTDNVGFSFDFMKVTLDNLHEIPKLKESVSIFESYSSKSLNSLRRHREHNAIDLDLYEKKVEGKIAKGKIPWRSQEPREKEKQRKTRSEDVKDSVPQLMQKLTSVKDENDLQERRKEILEIKSMFKR